MPVRKILCLSLGAEGQIVEGHLRRAGWEVACCSDVSAARSLLAQRKFSVALVVADAAQRLDEDGVVAVEACVHASLQTEWVALCEQAVLESHAFRALILNCFFDYQVLPLEWPDLDRMIEHAAQRALLRHGSTDALPEADTLGMVGQAASMVQLRKDIRKVAGAFAPVLIQGES
ncbi:MAG: VpsR-related response regulator, partial [Acidovorax defluvii]